MRLRLADLDAMRGQHRDLRVEGTLAAEGEDGERPTRVGDAALLAELAERMKERMA